MIGLQTVNMLHHTHMLCATSSSLQTCNHFSHHTVCMRCPPLQSVSIVANLAQPLCTWLGIQANSVLWECAGNLIGAADFLWAAAVLHILSKADCDKFVTSACLLLKPGGTFYGWTVGNREAGDWHTTPDGKAKRYLHSAVIALSNMLLSHFNVCSSACLPACLPSLNLSEFVTVHLSTCMSQLCALACMRVR